MSLSKMLSDLIRAVYPTCAPANPEPASKSAPVPAAPMPTAPMPTAPMPTAPVPTHASSLDAEVPEATSAEATSAEAASGQLPPGVTRMIDVSHLPPPLPMVRILDVLRKMEPGETLLVQLARRPIHLFPKLDALGCTHETTELAPGKVAVRITKPPVAAS